LNQVHEQGMLIVAMAYTQAVQAWVDVQTGARQMQYSLQLFAVMWFLQLPASETLPSKHGRIYKRYITI
jgi:hypothetical protein